MNVRLEISDGRIAASIPWDGGAGRDRAKSIPGARPKYDGSKFRYWTYPLAMSTCRAFRKEFGAALAIGPLLAAWAWDERRREEELEALRSGGADVDLPLVRSSAPALWQALEGRPYQLAGAAFITKGRRVCLGDEPRLGKTYQALAAIVEAGARRVLIACPKTAVHTVWARKINELAPKLMPFVAQGSRAEREQVYRAFLDTPFAQKALIINKEMIRVRRTWQCQIPIGVPPGADQVMRCPTHDRYESAARPGSKHGCQGAHDHKSAYHPEYPQLFEEPWDAIVLDESHHALASQYNKQSANITQIRLGAVKLPTAENAIMLAMSGTPFRSKVLKSWGTLNWLRPDVFSSFWRFAEEMFGVTKGDWGENVIGKTLKSEEAFQDTLRPYYLARTKAEVAPHLPPIMYAGTPSLDNPEGPVGVYLDMDPKQSQAYRQMAELAAADIDGGVVRANGVLAELMRLKQFANSFGRLGADRVFYPAMPSSKIDWILQFLEERADVPGKVVIVSQFTKMVHLVAEEIRKAKWEVVTLTGEDNDRQRVHMQDVFMTGSPRVAAINVFAGGEAIDLSAADEMVFIDEPWTSDVITQAENRIQNLAKRQQLTIYRLRSAGTIDEAIASLTEEQRRLLQSARPAALQLAKEMIVR